MTAVVAFMSRGGEEFDSTHPLLAREAGLHHERVQVGHQRTNDLRESRVRGLVEAFEHVGEVLVDSEDRTQLKFLSLGVGLSEA